MRCPAVFENAFNNSADVLFSWLQVLKIWDDLETLWDVHLSCVEERQRFVYKVIKKYRHKDI